MHILYAGSKRLFSCRVCVQNPVRSAKLVATLFQSVGWRPALPADANNAAAKLMLSFLKDLVTEMTLRWQNAHLTKMIQSMVKHTPCIRTLLTQVFMTAQGP